MAKRAGFGQTLREVSAGMSQSAISDRTGVSQGYIHDLLTKDRAPPPQTLERLGEGLRLVPQDRPRLFEAAGYVHPKEDWVPETESAALWPRRVVELAEQICRLP